MKKFGRFFGQNPKNNAIRLRRAKALRNENTVISSKRRPRLPERGARGENRLRLLSLRQNKDSRRVGGHAPPQRHPERSAATMKTRFTGRKQNKRSEFCCLPVLPRKRGSTGEKTHERASCEVRVFAPPSKNPVDITLQYHLCRQRIDHTASFF